MGIRARKRKSIRRKMMMMKRMTRKLLNQITKNLQTLLLSLTLPISILPQVNPKVTSVEAEVRRRWL